MTSRKAKHSRLGAWLNIELSIRFSDFQIDTIGTLLQGRRPDVSYR